MCIRITSARFNDAQRLIQIVCVRDGFWWSTVCVRVCLFGCLFVKDLAGVATSTHANPPGFGSGRKRRLGLGGEGGGCCWL